MTEVVAVIDYGMGNLHSASKALEKVASGQTILITSDPDQVRAADRVVFPGVGAIRDCIAVLRDTGLDIIQTQIVISTIQNATETLRIHGLQDFLLVWLVTTI